MLGSGRSRAGSKEADGGVGGIEGAGIVHSLPNSPARGEGDSTVGVGREAAGFVEGGDDGGGLWGFSKGVEVVGGGVGEEVVEDCGGIDGAGREELPLVEGSRNRRPPCVKEGRRGRRGRGEEGSTSRRRCSLSGTSRHLSLLAMIAVDAPTLGADVLLTGVPPLYDGGQTAAEHSGGLLCDESRKLLLSLGDVEEEEGEAGEASAMAGGIGLGREGNGEKDGEVIRSDTTGGENLRGGGGEVGKERWGGKPPV